MIYEYDDYRSFLKAYLERAIKDKPGYSLRTFAQELGLTHAAFSQVFKGVRNFSEERALDIADKLGLTGDEKEYFHSLVLSEVSRLPNERADHVKRVSQLKNKVKALILPADSFRVIADWYHVPILMMGDLADLEPGPEWVAKRLGITIEQASHALDRLERLELIEVKPDGKWRQKSNRVVMSSTTIPREDLISQFEVFAKMAIAAMREQPPTERISLTTTIAFPTANLQKANAITEEYFRKMEALSSEFNNNEADEVYHLSTHFFRMTK